jgi:3-deoxy-D-manno-octulosonic-acid transferase
MPWLANIAYLLAGVAYLPVLLYQMLFQKKNRSGWSEKLLGPRLAPPGSAVRRVWVHGVSLGEINAARQLVAGLERLAPDIEVVVSTTTDTGYNRACQLYGADRVFRYPLDFSWTVRRALQRIQPSLIVLIELEVWFNLVTLAACLGVPVAVVNGRLTERSTRRLKWGRFLTRRMFAQLAWVGAQDAEIATRFRQVGTPAERITITGSVKWDTAQVADSIDGAEELARALGIDGDIPLWVCGSTGPGEEAIILDAYAELRNRVPALRLAIVPRKPERFVQVAELIRSRHLACVRRSEHPDGAPFHGDRAANAVILGDTMGELRKFYSLARVVFVGRSLVPMGGSDPMEVAGIAKPVVVGPHVGNFAEPCRALTEGGGLRQVSDRRQLVEVVGELAEQAGAARQIGEAARSVVLRYQGATPRLLEGLARLLRP